MRTLSVLCLALLAACGSRSSGSPDRVDAGADASLILADTGKLLDDALEFFRTRSTEAGEDQARGELLDHLRAQPGIAQADLGDDGFTYWIFPVEGRPGVLVPFARIPDWDLSQLPTDEKPMPLPDDSTSCDQPTPARQDAKELEGIGARKLSIFDFSDDPSDNTTDGNVFGTWHGYRDDIAATFASLGFEVAAKRIPDMQDPGALLAVDGSGAVIFVSHGSLRATRPSLFTYIPWDRALAWSRTPEAQARGLNAEGCIERGADHDCTLVEYLSSDGTHQTLVTDRFFAKAYPALANGVVMMMACFGMATESTMPDTFLAHGAHSFVGNTWLGRGRAVGSMVRTWLRNVAEEGWDVRGALYRMDATFRTGAHEGHAPYRAHACTELRSRDGAQPLAVLSQVDVRVHDVPEGASTVTIEVSVGATGDVLASFELPAADGAAMGDVQVPSMTAAQHWVARAEGKEASYSGIVVKPDEQVSLRFAPPRIAYDRGSPYGWIEVVAIDGTGQTALTSGSRDYAPSWSPDGGQIAFQRISGGSFIYVMNADGTEAHVVAVGNDPSWSPDGEKIAFGDSYNIFVLDLMTGVTTSVTTDGTGEGTIRQYWDPAWSPDGSELAVTVFEYRAFDACGSAPYTNIGVVPAGGGAVTLITDGPTFSANPSWSPDGSQIVFTRNADVTEPSCSWGAIGKGLAIVSSSGGTVTRLASHGATPTWSPDGTRIAFSYDWDPSFSWDIFLIDPDGANETQLTFDGGGKLRPAWQPLPLEE